MTHGRDSGRLLPLGDTEHREVMRRWQGEVSGMGGARGQLPETPDDPVAHKLLDAAGEAMNRGDWRQGVEILQLVVKAFQHTQEAACARTVIDRLKDRAAGQGR